jgi:V/A-type H+-transporting ATPase subunit I
MEGWVKEHDYAKAEEIVNGMEASSIGKKYLAEGEVVPVEIENNKSFRPFETITRLYGMPANTDVDPTAFLAPFFTLFFGICLTDAGYGIILAGILWMMIRKLQGDKKALVMFMSCAIASIIAGALTGSWFSDATLVIIPESSSFYKGINNLRESIMLFDPMKDPMTFFKIALGLGYLQILFGICIAFFNNIKQKDYATAIFNHLTWFILLNSLLTLGLCKNAVITKTCSILAIIMAVVIFLFTERKSGMAGRIGGGLFAVFGAVFYFGDILSYVRLMALGMVTAGLGMAVNILVRLLMDIDIPVVGYVLGAILFVGGHLFNLAMGVLSAFVHSLRLQFVEFFPKFLEGGGKDFKPMTEKYDHVLVKQE